MQTLRRVILYVAIVFAILVAAWPMPKMARALNMSSYCFQVTGSTACGIYTLPTPSSYNMESYYKGLSGSALSAVTCTGATADSNGYSTSCLNGTLKFAEASLGGTAASVNSIAAVVPYVGSYQDVINGCGENASAGSTLCLPNMNPEETTGITALPTMPSTFFEVGSGSSGRVMDTTNTNFTFNQSTSSDTGAACGYTPHTFTSTTFQNNCTLNPVVPLPTASPVTYQLDPNIQNERYRANLESEESVVSTVWNDMVHQNDVNYLAASGAHGTTVYNYVFSDDSFNPGDSASYPVFYTWANTSFGQGSFAEAQITGGSYPYTNYNYTTWLSGLSNVLSSSTYPAIINLSGYQPDSSPGGVDGVKLPAPPSAITACGTGCLGASQETPWDNPYQTQNQPVSNLDWASNVNLAIWLVHNGKNFISWDEATNTPTGLTFTQAVSTGSQTVSVSGLVGVDVGSQITTATNAETVTVTAETATTLTATFANTHANNSGFSVNANQAAIDPSGLYVRRYSLASMLLACGDNIALCQINAAYQIDDSYDNPGSGLYLPVEAGIVPAGALATPPPIYNASSPTTTGAYAFEDTTQASGSTYVCPGGDGPTTGANCVFWREFSQVYNKGTRLTNGSNHGMAVVVAPGNGGTYKFPTLTQTYAHSLVISGFDYLQGTSTSGSLNVNGPACPSAGTSIHGQIAYICLP